MVPVQIARVHPMAFILLCDHLAHVWVYVTNMLTLPNKFVTLG